MTTSAIHYNSTQSKEKIMDTLDDLRKYVEDKVKEFSNELRDMEIDGTDVETEGQYYEGLVDAYSHVLSKINEVLKS